ncbi:MAG: hypothetical protein JOZ42_03890, partial [Acetobacteraceae bacterium]|nr:hypothetical protein [Acetobacteraceae bacterium]
MGNQVNDASEKRLSNRLEVQAGLHTAVGGRPGNEDYAALLVPGAGPEQRAGVVAAIADGVGGAKGGRAAAETAVRGFMDGH